ncbi:FACT complex subunit SSRP1-A-like isoform X2 [Mangifera indica]|uniref:FACT complex subunit SSRP1-A-like isoform X2 n=1 Tax=Mangifera indica TaxID=29780 RepID=UPI001CFB86DB|nr:FACT complex subunit SSRP1-A-like isoform X2 [Mangifera indica]
MPSEDAKAVKKEDTCENSLRSPLESRKKKPVNANAKPKVVKKEEVKDEDGDFDKPIKRVAAAGAKESRVKKEPNDVLDDDKPISKNNSTTTTNAAKTDTREPKKKKKKGEEKKEEVQQNGKKREKKVYDLPGQKRDPPEERDPLRIFYETLYKQVPNSEMAQFWMMESGLLSFDEAKEVFEKKQKRNQQQKLSSPKKSVSTVKKKPPPPSLVSSGKNKTTDSRLAVNQCKKRKVEDKRSEEDSDDEFMVKKLAKKQKAK